MDTEVKKLLCKVESLAIANTNIKDYFNSLYLQNKLNKYSRLFLFLVKFDVRRNLNQIVQYYVSTMGKDKKEVLDCHYGLT